MSEDRVFKSTPPPYIDDDTIQRLHIWTGGNVAGPSNPHNVYPYQAPVPMGQPSFSTFGPQQGRPVNYEGLPAPHYMNHQDIAHYEGPNWYPNYNYPIGSPPLTSMNCLFDSTLDVDLSELSLSSDTLDQNSISSYPKSVHSTVSRHNSRSKAETLHCEYCPETFNTTSKLKQHTYKHTLPHKCPFPPCTAAFAYKKDLNRHIASRKHEGNCQTTRRYLCPFPAPLCKYGDKGFARKDHYLRHMRTMHPGINVDCP